MCLKRHWIYVRTMSYERLNSRMRLTGSTGGHRRFVRVGRFCHRRHRHLDIVRIAFRLTYRDMSHLRPRSWINEMQMRDNHFGEMTKIHSPGKQGLAYWQVSRRRKFWGSWQAAQFSMSDWSRLMSACWLAMSCWSFFTKAIKSLIPRNRFSAEHLRKRFESKQIYAFDVDYHRNLREW